MFGQAKIGLFPDFVLLEIFDFYVGQAPEESLEGIEMWIALVHVCRKWRDVVFRSSRRLILQLLCTDTKCAGEMEDIWPHVKFPIIVSGFNRRMQDSDADEIIAALEHNDRVHRIKLHHSSSFHLQEVLVAMQKPFPALTDLALEFELKFKDRMAPIIPGSFLSGSAPTGLRSLRLKSIRLPFPRLRKLLLSATDLVEIQLWGIPYCAYISTEEISFCLSALTRLEEFFLGFEYFSSPDQETRRMPPSKRYSLHALTSLTFNGSIGYLENLILRIDAPILEHLSITFCEAFKFTPRLAHFIYRTPKFEALIDAYIFFDQLGVNVSLPWSFRRGFESRIMRSQSSWQLSTLAQLCSTTSFLRVLFPTVENLYIQKDESLRQSHSRDDIGNRQWLDILHQFTAVKRLYLSEKIAFCIAPILQSVGERATELLPALQSLHLEGLVPLGHVEGAIKQFVAARQLAGNSIAISLWIK